MHVVSVQTMKELEIANTVVRAGQANVAMKVEAGVNAHLEQRLDRGCVSALRCHVQGRHSPRRGLVDICPSAYELLQQLISACAACQNNFGIDAIRLPVRSSGVPC